MAMTPTLLTKSALFDAHEDMEGHNSNHKCNLGNVDKLPKKKPIYGKYRTCYVNMHWNDYFKKFKYIPITSGDMEILIECFNGSHIINQSHLRTIINNYYIGDTQLTALFLVLRFIDENFTVYYKKLPKRIVEYSQSLIYTENYDFFRRYFVESNAMVQLAEYILNRCKPCMEHNDFQNTFIDGFRKYFMIGKQFNNLEDMLDELYIPRQNFTNFTFELHKLVITNNVNYIYEETKYYIEKCAAKYLTPVDHAEFHKMIKVTEFKYKTIKCDALENFYQYIEDNYEIVETKRQKHSNTFNQNHKREYPQSSWPNRSQQGYTDLYETYPPPVPTKPPPPTTTTYSAYNYGSTNYGYTYGGTNTGYAWDPLGYIKNIANPKLNKLGFELYIKQGHNSYMHNFVDCLIEHEFVQKEEDYYNLIGQLMINDKDTMIKFHDTDMKLDEMYNTLCLANDIKTNFDETIEHLIKHKRLPYDIPIEGIMRITSRMFNVIINYFTTTLSPLEFDNTISKNNIKWIWIYNHEYHKYFNIIPLHSQFEPAGMMEMNMATYVSHEQVNGKKIIVI
jgi:hypothetical protein